MAFTVCQTRKTKAESKDASTKFSTKTKTTATLEYMVTSDQSPDQVTDVDALGATGLPTVNASTYFDANNNTSRPFMLCVDKSCRRDTNNGSVFWVTAKFEEIVDGYESGSNPCPNQLTDITPQVTAKVTAKEKVLYEDYSTPAVDCFRLPVVGEKYNTPATTDWSELVITVKQYEVSITFEEMMRRLSLVNSTTYRSKAAGRWKIIDVRVKEVEVTLCSGTTTAVLCEYDILLSEYSVGNYDNTQDDGIKDIFVGHDTALPLISRFYNDGSGKKSFADTATGYGKIGFILEDGNVKPDDTRPDYKVYITTKRGPFNFLQA
jgi:hypothetical protein